MIIAKGVDSALNATGPDCLLFRSYYSVSPLFSLFCDLSPFCSRVHWVYCCSSVFAFDSRIYTMCQENIYSLLSQIKIELTKMLG